MSLPVARREKQADGSNHYIIEWKGTTYVCTPAGKNGKNWQCDGVEYKTIGDFKEFLVGGTDNTTTSSPTTRHENKHTWSCLSPCVHLLLLVRRCNIEPYPQLIETLDAYGYLTADKQIDFERADREFQTTLI